MATRFKTGEEVRQIVTPIEGTVVERKVDGDDDLFLVAWVDADGSEHSRYFREDEICLK